MVRLDPFAFPSDTTLRFVLLVSFVFACAVLLALGTASDFIGPDAEAEMMDCWVAVVAAFEGGGPAIEELIEEGGMAGCLAPFSGSGSFRLVHLGNLAVVILAAVAAYYAHHLWIIRRHRLVPLPLDALPELARTLAELCGRAGLSRPVRFYWN